MATYRAVWISPNIPMIVEEVTTSTGELSMAPIIPYNNLESASQVPEDLIRENMDNLMSYIKERVEVSILLPPEGSAFNGWPMTEWDRVQEAATYLVDWWALLQRELVERRELAAQEELAALELQYEQELQANTE